MLYLRWRIYSTLCMYVGHADSLAEHCPETCLSPSKLTSGTYSLCTLHVLVDAWGMNTKIAYLVWMDGWGGGGGGGD